MIRIQRQRTRGWRKPEGAVYVGRPSLFGNPWSVRDAIAHDIPAPERVAWCVAMYRGELDHGGLLSDWGEFVSLARWTAMADLMDSLPQDIGAKGYQSVRPLFRHLLHDATALACWCPLCATHAEGLPAGVTCHDCAPCHASVLAALVSGGRE